MPPTQAWQLFAKTFHLVELFVLRNRLPEDFGPEDAIELRELAISTHEHSILSFVLHVWNRYDFPFELSAVSMWEPAHQQAFSNWANGKTFGQPCRYF